MNGSSGATRISTRSASRSPCAPPGEPNVEPRSATIGTRVPKIIDEGDGGVLSPASGVVEGRDVSSSCPHTRMELQSRLMRR